MNFDRVKRRGEKSDLVKRIDEVLKKTDTSSSSALMTKMKMKEPQGLEQEFLMRKRVREELKRRSCLTTSRNVRTAE